MWHVLIALVYIVGGIIAVTEPVIAGMTLALLIAWTLIVIGVLRLVMALQMRGAAGWLWTLLGGALKRGVRRYDYKRVAAVRLMGDWPFCCNRNIVCWLVANHDRASSKELYRQRRRNSVLSRTAFTGSSRARI